MRRDDAGGMSGWNTRATDDEWDVDVCFVGTFFARREAVLADVVSLQQSVSVNQMMIN